MSVDQQQEQLDDEVLQEDIEDNAADPEENANADASDAKQTHKLLKKISQKKISQKILQKKTYLRKLW